MGGHCHQRKDNMDYKKLIQQNYKDIEKIEKQTRTLKEINELIKINNDKLNNLIKN